MFDTLKEILGMRPSPYATLPDLPTPKAKAASSAPAPVSDYIPVGTVAYGANDVRTVMERREPLRDERTGAVEWLYRSEGGKSGTGQISAVLSEAELTETRSRSIPDATAAKLKERFAAAGGNVTAQELASLSGLSLSYAQKFTAAIRAAQRQGNG